MDKPTSRRNETAAEFGSGQHGAPLQDMGRRHLSLLERWRAYLTVDPRQVSGREIGVFLVTGGIVSIATIAAVAWKAGFENCWHQLVHVHWMWLAVAPGAILVSHVGYLVAYRSAAHLGKGPEIPHGHAAALVATGFGPFNPRGGFAVDTQGLGDLGLKPDAVRLRVRVLATLEYAVLAPAAWISALIMLLDNQRALAGLIPSWLIGVPAGAGATGILALIRASGRSLGSTIDGWLQAIGETLRMLIRFPAGTFGWAGMALYWAGEIAALGVCLGAIGHRPVRNAAVIVAYATGYAVTRRTLPLAGAGAVEFFMPLALTWISYPLSTAVVTVVAYRIFNLWFTLPPAALGLHHLRTRARPRRRAAALT